MKIDVHNHAIPETVVDLLRRESIYRVKIDGDRVSGGNHPAFTLLPSFTDPAAKLAELELNGLQAAVISPAPPIFFYEVDQEAAEAICAATNRGLIEYCRHSSDRFRWLAHVPLGFPEIAARALRDAESQGCVGVEIATSIAGRRLDEPRFETFWAEAERLSLPVMIHPAYNQPHPALEPYYLQNVVGNLLETTIAIERLICAGILDRHPSLKILLVHAGGYYPFQAGRLRHARAVRPELSAAPADPWKYRRQIIVDTITHDTAALAYLVARMGVESVVLGTDLPFDMATPQPLQALSGAVDAEAARRIAEENPTGLFRFDEKEGARWPASPGRHMTTS
jgi:aminocarboxymuconate-semialdehyde decarboxylase